LIELGILINLLQINQCIFRICHCRWRLAACWALGDGQPVDPQANVWQKTGLRQLSENFPI
jgi:hypothetical protein